MSYPLSFVLAEHFGILKGGSKVYADRGTLVNRNGWKIAAGVDVLECHTLRLTVLEELNAAALQDVQILQRLSDLVLVLVVQMRLELDQRLGKIVQMINNMANQG